jgi:hypothetical protein
MGAACSSDIFQANISELMATLEFVRAYIDDLLCNTKGDFDDHLAQLKLVLKRLQIASCESKRKRSQIKPLCY